MASQNDAEAAMSPETMVSLSARKAELQLLAKVVEVTGLPEAIITSMLVSNDDLDALCDALLAQIFVQFKKVANFNR